MRILVIAQGMPFPPFGGGLLRTYHLSHGLAHEHQVTLAAFTYGHETLPAGSPLRLLPIPWEPPPAYRAMYSGEEETWRAAYTRLAGEHADPWFASCVESAAMERAVQEACRSGCDLVLVQGSAMGRFCAALPAGLPRILDLFDVHSLMAERAGGADRVERARTLRFERAVAAARDLCLVVSGAEREAATRLLGIDRVAVIPNGIDTEFFETAGGDGESGHILFTGKMDYPPNVRACEFFVRDVLPRIRAVVPDATFHIVGTNPAPDVRALAGPDVVVHGRVEDMRDHFGRAQVVAVPILDGGGTRIKILEAAASQKAIVSTPAGAEGLDFGAEALTLASSADGFAAAVIDLLADPVRRAEMGRAARAAVAAYDWRRIAASLSAAVSTAGARQQSPACCPGDATLAGAL